MPAFMYVVIYDRYEVCNDMEYLQRRGQLLYNQRKDMLGG